MGGLASSVCDKNATGRERNTAGISPIRLIAGRTRIKLRKTGEVYSLVPPNSKAHNVIVGGTWVDCYGDFKLSNVTPGTQ